MLLIVAIFILPLCDCKLESLVEDEGIQMSLAVCMTTAAEKFFKQHESITFLIASTDSTGARLNNDFSRTILHQIYSISRWPVLVTDPTKPEEGVAARNRSNGKRSPNIQAMHVKKTDNYILRVGTVEEVNTNLDYFMGHRYAFNPSAKFLLVGTKKYEEFVRYGIISRFWAWDILHGVVLLPVDDAGDVHDVYTWYPYADGKCGKGIMNITKIAGCSYNNITGSQNWFGHNLPNNLNKCVFKARTLVYPPFVMHPYEKVANAEDEYIFDDGFEIKLLNMVAEVANFSISYSMSGKSDDYGVARRATPPPPNLSSVGGHNLGSVGYTHRSFSMNANAQANASTGILDMLERKEADIGIGFMSLSLYKPSLEWSFTYTEDALAYCVPHSELKPLWEKLMSIISLGVWVTLLTTGGFMISMMVWASRRLKGEYAGYKDGFYVFLKFLQMITVNVITPQPVTTTVRFFFLLWATSSLYVSTLYQTFLTSSLTKNDYEDQISTPRELLGTNLKLLFTDSSKQYFNTRGDDDNDMLPVKKRWETCENMEECLNRTAQKRDCAVASSRLFTKYRMGTLVNKRGEPQIHCFHRNILTFPIVMFMRKGLPIRSRINAIIVRAYESGFVHKWEDEAFDTLRLISSEEAQEGEALIKFQHLIPVFTVCNLGHITAIYLFIGELLVHRYKKWQAIRKRKMGKNKEVITTIFVKAKGDRGPLRYGEGGRRYQKGDNI